MSSKQLNQDDFNELTRPSELILIIEKQDCNPPVGCGIYNNEESSMTDAKSTKRDWLASLSATESLYSYWSLPCQNLHKGTKNDDSG